MPFAQARATAEIDTAALISNFATLQAHAARCKKTGKPPRVIAVVKANAYGHGTALAVSAFLRAGCDFFAVATVDEAIAVRHFAPEADILILGYTPPCRAAELGVLHLTQTVFSPEYARALSSRAVACGALVEVHLKIDGGMCRLGFAPSELAPLLAAVRLPGLYPTGLYTHFPSADCDLPATRAALLRFLSCKAALEGVGLSLFSHAAASAALLALPEAVLDGVRPGLALYGIAPVKSELILKTALRITAPIIQIHSVTAGTPVGYGGSFCVARPSRIGTVPIGYGDGLPRRFEQAVGALTLLHKKHAFSVPIAGHICMDQLMLDLTDTPATVGDRVLLWQDAAATAAALDTIPYELLTALSARVTRKEKD